MDRSTNERGFVRKGEAIRDVVCLYLNLLALGPRDRVRTFQLINGLIAPSATTTSDLIEEGYREEDEL